MPLRRVHIDFPLPLTSRLVTLLAAWFAGAANGLATTQFGGMVHGLDGPTSNLLHTLAGRPGIRWIRESNPRLAPPTFSWLGDVRTHLERADRSPRRLPTDLFEVYWTCRSQLPTAPGVEVAWEIWNEPDFYFVDNSAADMMAVVKAAWWGVRHGQPAARLLMPSLAFRPSRYALELAFNGLASWTDGLNIHFYGWPADYRPFLRHHRTFAEAIHLAPPTWVTEVGWLRLPAHAAGDPSHLDRQAAFHERVMAESVAAGVDVHLAFILTPFTDSGNDLGLAHTNGTWRPALHAFASMAARLESALPRWRLRHTPSRADLGLVFEESDGGWWSILWAPGTPIDPGLALDHREGSRANAGPVRLRVRWPSDLSEIRVGSAALASLAPSQLPTLTLEPTRNLHLRTPPHRYHLQDCRWEPVNARGVEPTVPRAFRRELARVPHRLEPSPVVLRLDIEDGSPLRPHKPRQTLQLERGSTAALRLQLHHFGDRAVPGRCGFTVPDGWRIQCPGAGAVDTPAGSPASDGLRLEPLSRTDLPLVLACDATAPSEPGRLTIRWLGDDGSIDQVSFRLEPRTVDVPPVWTSYTWRDVHPSPNQPDAWQLFEVAPRTFSLEIQHPSGPQGDVALHLPVPSGARPSDVLSLTLRPSAGTAGAHAQVFLVTGHGEVWRYDEWRPVPPSGLTWQAALGDFAPSAWSRHRTLGSPPVADARWLVVRMQGVRRGDVVEVVDPSLRRARRTR